MYYTLTHPVEHGDQSAGQPAQVEEDVRLAQEFTPLSEAQLTDLGGEEEPSSARAGFLRRWA